jgi:hypothetical protein
VKIFRNQVFGDARVALRLYRKIDAILTRMTHNVLCRINSLRPFFTKLFGQQLIEQLELLTINYPTFEPDVMKLRVDLLPRIYSLHLANTVRHQSQPLSKISKMHTARLKLLANILDLLASPLFQFGIAFNAFSGQNFCPGCPFKGIS